MATLIISYDCEGLWGMLDILEELDPKKFNRENLLSIYQRLIELHEKYKIPATFAFVSAFVLNKEKFFNHIAKHGDAKCVHNWISEAFTKNKKFRDEDFFIPEIIEMIKQSELNHEIATQGFSHTVMTDDVNCKDIELELEGIGIFDDQYNIRTQTIIFPRNVVNHSFLKKSKNLIGYRRAPKNPFRNSLLKRIYSLLKEFIPFCGSEQHKTLDGKIEIPGDFFINWRSGLRKLVPIYITKKRFETALRHAIKNKGIVHIWLHPHNLITGHKQLLLLEELLSIAEKMITDGKVNVMTQEEFCFSCLRT